MFLVDGQVQGFVFFTVSCHTVQRGAEGAVRHIGSCFVTGVGNSAEISVNGQGVQSAGVVGVIYSDQKISGIALVHRDRNHCMAAVSGVEQEHDGFRF